MGCGDMEAEFTSGRDTRLMKSGEFGAERLGIREFRAHIFKVENEEVSDRRRTVELAPYVWLWDERRRESIQLDHSCELAFHHCLTTISSRCALESHTWDSNASRRQMTGVDFSVILTFRKYRFSAPFGSKASIRAVMFHEEFPQLSAERTLVPAGKARQCLQFLLTSFERPKHSAKMCTNLVWQLRRVENCRLCP